MKFTLAVMVLLLLLPLPGCSKKTTRTEPRQEAAEAATAARVETPTPPGSARRGDASADTAPGSAKETPVNAAFYASGDEGPSGARRAASDYELGELMNPIPPGIDTFFEALGGELPADIAAGEWAMHLRRQSALFDSGKREVRLARGSLDNELLTAACKIIQGEEMILGFLIARQEGDGYRVQDISIDRRVQAPFQPLVLPPPTGDGSGRRAAWELP